MTSTIVANMRHAVRNHEITFIGGGEFSPSEIKEAADLIEDCGRLQPMNAELLAALESCLALLQDPEAGADEADITERQIVSTIAKAKGQS